MAQVNSTKRKRDGDKEPHGKRRKGVGIEGTTERERETDPGAQEASVKAYLFHASKLLLKALKKSRTFELQKVVRKLKSAREPKEGAPDAAAISHLEAQLAALTALSLDPITPHLLSTRLPKLSFLHPILPSLLSTLPTPPPPSIELDPKNPAAKARNRTLANKLVKEAWDEVSRAVSKRMGQKVEDRPVPVVVPVVKKAVVEVVPVLDAEGNEIKPKRLSKRAERAAKGAAKALLPKAGMNAARKAAIAAAVEEESDEGDGEEEYADVGSGSEMDDDEEVMRELARLGSGSGSDDFSDNNQSDADDDGYVSGSSIEAPKLSKSRPAKEAPLPKSRKPAKAPTSSAFLPSLAGGYISYSDSDGEDAKWVKESEKGDKKERKNRRGQRARQAIWEAKYGSGANHIAKTTGAVPAVAKGGKANSGAPKPRSKPAPIDAAPEPFDPSKQRGAENNANAQPVAPRKASTVEKGMHPSWEAKRKAADALAAVAAAPKGKKITFD